MHMLWCIVLVSENVLIMGTWGKGFSLVADATDASEVRRGRRRGWDRATRRRSFGIGASESSLEGVKGGVGGNDDCSLMTVCRVNETVMVASAAISLASSGDRGVVVNTTKYGIDDEREKVTDVGRVI